MELQYSYQRVDSPYIWERRVVECPLIGETKTKEFSPEKGDRCYRFFEETALGNLMMIVRPIIMGLVETPRFFYTHKPYGVRYLMRQCAAQYMRCIAISQGGWLEDHEEATRWLRYSGIEKADVGSVKLAPSHERGAKQPPWVLPGFGKCNILVPRQLVVEAPGVGGQQGPRYKPRGARSIAFSVQYCLGSLCFDYELAADMLDSSSKCLFFSTKTQIARWKFNAINGRLELETNLTDDNDER
ncbi:hypothetical protein BJV77DRAFT_961792 [Russula vinacea]|nr:hypothetical protein BJV77DRAFT_961792 [Russula vinacea]